MSAIWPQKGMKAALVRLKEDTIQFSSLISSVVRSARSDRRGCHRKVKLSH